MSENRPKVFVVEDEPQIAKLIQYNLSVEDFDVSVFGDGAEGYRAITQASPDIVLLDIMLPSMDGVSICQKLKRDARFRNIPIIMVSAKGSEKDIVDSLEMGADDYITKPFSPKILVARVKSVLRRSDSPASDNKEINYQGIVIHPGRREVFSNGQRVSLTGSEFDILYFLLKKPGWVFTRSQIVNAVRGDNYAVTERSIDVQIVGLRKKLGQAAECIETVRGVGYRVKEGE